MRVTLDGLEVPGPVASLGDAIDCVRRMAGEGGRLVVEAVGDGAPIADALLEHPERAGSYGLLEFKSADPRALIADALEDSARLVRGVRDEQAAVVASIDAAEIGAATRGLERVLGVWSACVATVRDGGQMLGLDMASPVAGAPAPERLITDLSAALGEVKRCASAEDWAGLSDVVGDDLERLALQWDELLTALAGQVGRPSGT